MIRFNHTKNTWELYARHNGPVGCWVKISAYLASYWFDPMLDKAIVERTVV
jgi:hypothetical protein